MNRIHAMGAVFSLAIPIMAAYMGWRNMRRNKSKPAYISDPWLPRLTIALLVAKLAFFAKR